MQFYNKLKHKFQQSRTSSQSPTQDLGLSQHKPPVVESRSQWNTNVYLVPKWEPKAIQRVDSSLHTPFPTRNYINYVELHSGGFKQELNLDFFKHIFRHFALNQWWIDEARKFKASISINILQSPEVVYQNPDYRRLVLQKHSDDLKFYKEIIANVKSPPQPFTSQQIPEYRKSITYQILDLHAGQQYKDKSLFQLQDVFVNRIIQLISNNGIKILGYYDYQTFKNIVQDRIKGYGDAENFAKVLEIKRLFNSIDRIQRECEYTVQEWQRQDTIASNKTKTKFRRWQQEKTLFSEEMLELAEQVGLKINLVKARKLYEMNQTEQNFKELVNVGDQIQLSTHKTIIDTLSKIAQDEINNFSSSNNLIEEDALQIARNHYEEQKKVLEMDQSQITKQVGSEQPSSRACSDIFQKNQNEQFCLEYVEEKFNNDTQFDQAKNLNFLDSEQESGIEQQRPFLQYKQKQQLSQLNQEQNKLTEKRIGIVSENNSRSGNTSNQNKTSRNKIQSSDHDRLIHSQWSQKSFKPFEDLMRASDSVHNFQDAPQRSSLEYYQQFDYQDPQQSQQQSSRKISQNLSQIQRHNLKPNSGSSSSVVNSQHAKNTNNSIQDDIKLLSEFVQQNREAQQKLKEKIFLKEQEKETQELQQIQQQLEIISKDGKEPATNKSKKTVQSEERIQVNRNLQNTENRISETKISQNKIQRHVKQDNLKEPNENIVKLDCGYNVPSVIPGSNSNNTTARTSRNTSNYNSTQVKKSKVENIEEMVEEAPQPQKTIQEDIQSQEEVPTINVRNASQKLSRQTSIKTNLRSQERKPEKLEKQEKLEKPESRSQNKDSKHERQQQAKTREGSIQTSQFKEQAYNIETKQDESNNYLNSQQSSENSPMRTKNTSKSQEKSTRFQKSVTKIIDKNKQQKREKSDPDVGQTQETQQDKQEKRKSRHKTGNRDQIEETNNDEDEEEQQNNLRLKRQKSMKKGQYHSVSMPKISRDDETRRYLLILKEELKEMLEKKCSLKEIKEHINIILSEIAGVKLDPELEYYLQLYKSRVQELSSVNQQSKEIYFQTLQPTVELTLRREIKGLKFAKNCDRIPKLQPQDLEDIFVLQAATQREFDYGEIESQAHSYQPTFRYEQRPLPIQSDLIQVSLDVSRKQTPNTQRYERTGSLLDRELPRVIERIKPQTEKKKCKRVKCIKPLRIKRDKLSEDFPYLQKYKPELLKSILEARISLEQLV